MDKNQLNIMLEQIRQQSDEPPDAYQGFLAYAAMHGTERNLRLVADKTGYHHKTVVNWSYQHRWVERAAMVDAQRWLADEENRQKLMEDDNRRFADKTRQQKEKIFSVTDKMLDTADKLLQKALEADTEVIEAYVTDQAGNEVPVKRVIKMKAKISDIRGLVDSSVKNSRLANDLPTEIITNKDMPLPQDLSTLSFEELEALRRKNLEKVHGLGANIKIDEAIG